MNCCAFSDTSTSRTSADSGGDTQCSSSNAPWYVACTSFTAYDSAGFAPPSTFAGSAAASTAPACFAPKRHT